MSTLEALVALFVLATLRYLPVVVLPGMSPLRWAPALVRIVLLMGLAWMTVLSMPSWEAPAAWRMPLALVLAGCAELMLGLCFGLAVMIPQGALHTAGWLADTQAGLSAANLFDPGGQAESESLLGRALLLAATVLFFTLDLHLQLFRLLAASTQVLPLGQVSLRMEPEALLGLLSSSFLLALMVVAPVLLGLLAVDVGVAYASRSMPQANVYFLVLPLKIAVALLLMVATLPLVPALMGRLFRDALGRTPALLGA